LPVIKRRNKRIFEEVALMRFQETENKNLPTIILLHGGGLSSWALTNVVEILQVNYHVVTPILDGYGEDSNHDFISIEDSAQKLISYIEQQHNGKVFALGGLSIGAQIVTEVLTQRENIAEFAILESALVLPIKGTKALTVPTFKLSYGLIKMRWFSKLQAKTLFVPDTMFEQYYSDSLKISKQTLINTTLSNGTYALKNEIEKTKTKVLVIVGEKEIKLMRKSAELLHGKIPNNKLIVLPNMGHGELSMLHPMEYAEILEEFFVK